MKVVIVEDEPFAAERLREIIDQVRYDLEVVAAIDSVKEAVQFFKSYSSNIDLVLMDVELGDGTCFEICEQVDIEAPLIFTTAYNQYAIKAFDLNSIHYLLKPVTVTDLDRALAKMSRQPFSSIDMMAIKNLMTSTEKFKSRFLCKLGNQLVHIPIEEVCYFYSEDNITYLVDKGNRRLVIDYNLEELSSQYLNPKTFFRVSRKFIINIEEINLIKRHRNQRLQLFMAGRQEHEIVVSRDRVPEFKNWLDH